MKYLIEEIANPADGRKFDRLVRFDLNGELLLQRGQNRQLAQRVPVYDRAHPGGRVKTFRVGTNDRCHK